jgi:hypothetical protein
MEQRQPGLAAGLLLELGDALQHFGHVQEATTQYQKAAELQAGSPADQAHSLGLQASCKIELGTIYFTVDSNQIKFKNIHRITWKYCLVFQMSVL